MVRIKIQVSEIYEDFLIIAFKMSPFGPVRSLISHLESLQISENNPYQLPKSVPAWICITVMPVMLNVIEVSHQID